MSSSTAGDGRDTRLRVQPGGGLPRAGSAASLPTTVAPPLSTGEKARSLRVRQAAVALCYMGSAILLIVFNKAALSSYSFNFPSAHSRPTPLVPYAAAATPAVLRGC